MCAHTCFQELLASCMPTGMHRPMCFCLVTACLGFFCNTGPHAAATESKAMVCCQFRESLGCQRNHITTIQQMNSNNATALGWPYLYWASQECQDFSIHKKCTSGTNYLCHFSSTPQSQMIHIVRRPSVSGLAYVSPLHRFRE